MISLSTWFQKNGRRPLLTLSFVLLLSGGIYALYGFVKESELREKSLTELAGLLSASVTQNNRLLVEILLESAKGQLGATRAELWERDEIRLSSSGVVNPKEWNQRSVRVPLAGVSGYYLVAYFSIFDGFQNWVVFSVLTSVGLFGCVLVLKNLERRFRNDVIEPLQAAAESRIALPIVEFERIRVMHKDLAELRTQAEVHKAVLAKDKQIAHDIRSPLTALSMLLSGVKGLSENERLLFRRAVESISDITNTLSDSLGSGCIPVRRYPNPSERFARPVAPELEVAVSQARLQWQGRTKAELELDASHSYGLFARFDPVELRRVLTNLINNSIEAIEGAGSVLVSLGQREGAIEIQVTDTGHGVPDHLVPHLGRQGATFGKVGGSGLGLFHAKTTLESWGGTLKIVPSIPRGTMVAISLPLATAPAWFVPRIEVTSNQSVVVLDDDASIHQIWDNRFAQTAKSGTRNAVIHLHSQSELEIHLRNSGNDASTFFIDHELLGDSSAGLNLIEQLGLADRSILVTSYALDLDLQRMCEALGVKLLPKSWAPSVPIGIIA